MQIEHSDYPYFRCESVNVGLTKVVEFFPAEDSENLGRQISYHSSTATHFSGRKMELRMYDRLSEGSGEGFIVAEAQERGSSSTAQVFMAIDQAIQIADFVDHHALRPKLTVREALKALTPRERYELIRGVALEEDGDDDTLTPKLKALLTEPTILDTEDIE